MTTFEKEFRGWSVSRQKAFEFVTHRVTENFMALLIVSNVVVMLFEANQRASCYPEECQEPVIIFLNLTLLTIYTAEAMLHAYVDRERYFFNGWNILDFLVVTFGWLAEVLMQVTDGGQALQVMPLMRGLRVARLLRAVKWIRFFPELYIMIEGFFGALWAMFWGLVLIMALITFWSLITIEVFTPINYAMMQATGHRDPYCEEAFKTVFNASILLFQTLVAGDSWGRCIIPIMQYHPSLACPLFAMALVSVSAGFMNLILAVIVDNASKAREADKEQAIKDHQAKVHEAFTTWGQIIEQIDDDGSGTISRDELITAFEVPKVQQTLEVMGLDPADLDCLFDLLDRDNAGELKYQELLDAFLKSQSQDLRTYLMMQRIQGDSVSAKVKRLAEDMATLVSTNPLESLQTVVSTACPDDSQESEAPSKAMWADPPSVEADMKAFARRIDQQFAALARSIQVNSVALSQHTRALEQRLAVRSRDGAQEPSPRITQREPGPGQEPGPHPPGWQQGHTDWQQDLLDEVVPRALSGPAARAMRRAASQLQSALPEADLALKHLRSGPPEIDSVPPRDDRKNHIVSPSECSI